jgi:competence protein ComEA
MRIRNLRSGAAIAAVCLFAAASALADAAPKGPSGPRLVGVVNVNAADAEQLELLPGVGPAIAKAIVAYRAEHGPFEKVEDLEKVSGIGPRALERMRPHCSTSGKTTARVSP